MDILILVYFYLFRVASPFSIYPVLLVLLLFITRNADELNFNLSDKVPKGKERIAACIFAFLEAMGFASKAYSEYVISKKEFVLLAVLGVIVWSEVFLSVLRIIYLMLGNLEKKCLQGRLSYKGAGYLLGSMIIFRTVFILNWYPGLITKDTFFQIQQALGIEQYNNHNPWIITKIIEFFLQAGQKSVGTNQAGIVLISLFSLIVTSIILTSILKYFYDNHVSISFWILAVIMYTIDPIQCIYSISIWKDTLFAYALVFFVFCLIIADRQMKERKKIAMYIWPIYILSSFCFCFFRTNGLYAWFFSVPFILYHYRRRLKPWLLATLAALGIIVGYKGWVLPHLSVTPPDTVEALTVPLQQIAFTVREDGNFSEQDIKNISHIVDVNRIGEVYSSHTYDYVKNTIRQEGNQAWIKENKLEFLKTYFSMGIKNPAYYVIAFLNQSRGYWHQKMSNNLYFEEGVHRFANELGIYRNPIFPESISSQIDKGMEKYCNLWHRLWSLALNTYCMLIVFFYCFINKRGCFYYIPVIGVFLTLVVATPLNDEFRYAYGIYLALPLMLMNVKDETVIG